MDFKEIMLSGKKKVNFKKLCTVWFHFYNILKMTKLERWRTNNWLPGDERVIDGETVSDFIFLGSKITADGDCSHEI